MKHLGISAAAILLADQASKFWVLEVLNLNERLWVPVMPPYLNFHMAWNRGVNFGLFGGLDMRWILVAVAIGICAMVMAWAIREKLGRIAMISAGLLIGGAIGNVIDRIRYGAVVDFLNMSCCGIENPYAFNVADIGVFAGAIGLILFSPSKPKPGRKGRKGS